MFDPADIHILIVDDDADDALLTRRALNTSGFGHISHAGFTTQALQYLQTQKVDLVLMDVNMPGMDGITFCKQLKDSVHTAHIPVLFLTSMHDSTNRIEGFKAGGMDYVHKPVGAEELNARVRAHLNNSILEQRLYQHNLQQQNELEHAKRIQAYQHQVFLKSTRRFIPHVATAIWPREALVAVHLSCDVLTDESVLLSYIHASTQGEGALAAIHAGLFGLAHGVAVTQAGAQGRSYIGALKQRLAQMDVAYPSLMQTCRITRTGVEVSTYTDEKPHLFSADKVFHQQQGVWSYPRTKALQFVLGAPAPLCVTQIKGVHRLAQELYKAESIPLCLAAFSLEPSR